MNTLVATGSARRSRPHADVGAASPAPAGRPADFPLLLFGLVMALALLSFFAQVLNEHVQHAQMLHQTQYRSAAPIDLAAPEAPEFARQSVVQSAAH